jgi:hypothetical protein
MELARKHYGKIKAYADSLTARAEVNDKLNHTLLDTGGWGDWCAPTGNTSKGGCGGHGTCGGSYEYISAIRTVKSWAEALGNAGDLSFYTALETKVAFAFDAAYFHETSDSDNIINTNEYLYSSDSPNATAPVEAGYTCGQTTGQTANALGLRVNPSGTAAAALVEAVLAKDAHFDTGWTHAYNNCLYI